MGRDDKVKCLWGLWVVAGKGGGVKAGGSLNSLSSKLRGLEPGALESECQLDLQLSH